MFSRMIKNLLIAFLLLSAPGLYAQTINFNRNNCIPHKVTMSIEKLDGLEVIKVIKDSSVQGADEPTFVKIDGVNFKNGTIEVKVLSKLLKEAPDFARGFIGVAFHINDSMTKFENFYIRPTNARADDQVRRNHSIQYCSYPDYKFDRLRKESPERYESYADMELNQWITLRIEVKDVQAKLFVNNSQQASLVVNDLKLGATASGSIGLWVDIGTEGYFRDLKVIKL
jgi:hypothetical protein